MKKFLILILFSILVSCCHVEHNTPVNPASTDFDIAKATLVKKGDLMGIGHTASGVASVYVLNGKHRVVLDPYSSQNGPDLKVYLSKDEGASEYIRLGNLKSTMGVQDYAVPGGTDITQYNFIHVWCEKFTVVFAQAEVH